MNAAESFPVVSANELLVHLARIGVFRLCLTSQLKHLKVIKRLKEDVVERQGMNMQTEASPCDSFPYWTTALEGRKKKKWTGVSTVSASFSLVHDI